MTMDDMIERLRAVDERTQAPHAFDLTAALRRGRIRARRRRAAQLGTGVVAACVLAAGALAVWPEAEQTDSYVASPETAPADVLSLLSTPSGPADDLHPDVDLSNIMESTARALAETDGIRFWAAVGTQGDVCLVVLQPSTPSGPDFAAGCTAPEYFRFSGVGLQLGNTVDAWLLPDGYVLSSEEAESWNLVAPNLALAVAG